MKYDIYFHDDFDGRASAAVMLSFLRSRGDDIEHFVPVGYYLEEEWKKNDFFKKHKLFKGTHNPAIVVDFLYHPAAALWFDHHATTVKKKEWKKNFRTTKFHVLDPKQPSCCHLVYATLKKTFGWKPPRHIADLVRAADLIDAAMFKNLEDAVFLRGPAMIIEAFIDANGESKKTARWTVEALAAKPLPKIAALPAVRAVARRVRARNRKNLAFCKKHIKMFPNATYIDLTRNPEKFIRWAQFYLYPDIPYAVRFIKKDGGYGLRAYVNLWAKPGVWKKTRFLDLGELCARYGGGGHKGAAGINLPTRKGVEAIIPDFLAQIARASKGSH